MTEVACTDCGAGLREDAKFCAQCGADQRRACPGCGMQSPPSARFCSECGTCLGLAGRSAPHVVAAPPGASSGDSAYRHVTVMFCDIVDSTPLSELLDPETLRDAIALFQRAVHGAVEPVGGHVASYHGDGFLIYFGYPVALEDAAERAALASLDLLARLRVLNAAELGAMGAPLEVRIGLNTGTALVGDLGEGKTAVRGALTGVSANIASRLQALAPPGGVVLGPTTARLVARSFDLEAMGPKALKGVSEPVETFSLRAQRDALDEALGHDRLIGREAELGALVASWGRGASDAKFAQMTGDAGIGKSALIDGFRRELGEDIAPLMVLGSPYDADSPFAALLRTGTKDAAARTIPRTLALIAAAETTDSDDFRRRIAVALAEDLSSLHAPQLVIVEDAHWIDASTLDLVDRVLRARTLKRGLVLIVSRPGQVFPWDDLPALRLELAGVDPGSCAEIASEVGDGLPLERRLADLIHTHTGGVPLFAAEVMRMMVRGGVVRQEAGRWILPSGGERLDLPDTLADLLAARLDRLGPLAAVAETASVINGPFTAEELAAVMQADISTVAAQIQKLIDAQIVIRDRNVGPDGARFRHALFRQTAYERMLLTRRKALHARYLAWLKADPARLSTTRREVLAQHCAASGALSEAAEHWTEAGRAASRLSADRDASRLFASALDCLDALPEPEQDAARTLHLLTLLGGALMTARGPGAEETRAIYDRAVALGETLPVSAAQFPAWWGWWRVSENFTVMRARAERLLSVAEGMAEPECKMQAHHCAWVNSFMVGDHAGCQAHAARGLALLRGGDLDDLGSLYGGHDPSVCALGEQALSCWLSGEGTTAQARIKAAVSMAEASAHVGSVLHAQDIAATLAHYTSSTEACARHARKIADLAAEHDIPDAAAKALIYGGWARLAEGDEARGMAEIETGLERMREVGTREDFPVYFTLLAHARRKAGDVAGALALLDEGVSVIADEGVLYWAAELYRERAEALFVGQRDGAAQALDEAARIAASQGARALSLRAAYTRQKLFPNAVNAAALRDAMAAVDPVDNRDHAGCQALLAATDRP